MKHDSITYKFGEFRFIPSESLLLRNDTPVPISAKCAETLLILVRGNGHLIEKSELIRAVWSGVVVEEGNLATVISILRKALGDDRKKPRYIETVSKRGYRFVAAVRAVPNTANLGVPLKAEPEPPIADTPVCEETPGSSLRRRWVSLPPAVTYTLLLLISLAVIGTIARNRVSARTAGVQPTFSTDKESISPERNEVPDTYQSYSGGQGYTDTGMPGLRGNIKYFEQAILKNPQYAEAYSGLAYNYSLLAPHETEAAPEQYALARAAALRAVQLNGSLAEPHTSLGMVYFGYEWNCPKAEREFQSSIKLNPKYIPAYIAYANCLGSQGRFNEALEQARRAQAVDPGSALASAITAYIYYLSRQYEKSISALRHAVTLDPSYAAAHVRLALDYVFIHDYSDALRESEEGDRLSSADPLLDGLSGYIEARSGKPELAQERLARLLERSQLEYTPAFSMALISIGLGEHTQALDWLDKAYQQHSQSLIYANVDPLLDPERGDQRFAALLSEIRPMATDASDRIIVDRPQMQDFAETTAHSH